MFIKAQYYLVLAVALMIGMTAGLGHAGETSYQTKRDVRYREGREGQENEPSPSQCVLDVLYPTNLPGFSTVVWFHGGGLTSGNKYFPAQLLNQNLAVVAVNYRLIPEGKYTDCLEDAASAVAWTLKHIEEFGGDPNRVYLSGHSAGAYLSIMVVTFPRESYQSLCE